MSTKAAPYRVPGLEVTGDEPIKISEFTEATKGSPKAGRFGFNKDKKRFEGADGDRWGLLGGSGFVEEWTVSSVDTSVVDGQGVWVDTSTATEEPIVALPSDPEKDDLVAVGDYAGTFGVRACKLNLNGKKFMGQTQEVIFDSPNMVAVFQYTDETVGWKIVGGVGLGGASDAGSSIEIAPTQHGNGTKQDFNAPHTAIVNPVSFIVVVDGKTMSPQLDYTVREAGKIYFYKAPTNGVRVDIRYLRSKNAAPDGDVSATMAAVNGGVPRSISEHLSRAPTVEDFGAVGDGKADDTEAFKNALAAFPTVSLGPKTYRVTDTVELDDYSRLVGNKSTIFFDSDTGNCVQAQGKRGISISNIKFKGKNGNSDVTAAINLYAANNTVINDGCFMPSVVSCEFEDIGSAIRLVGATNAWIAHNRTSRVKRGILVRGKSLENVFVANTIFARYGGYAVLIDRAEETTTYNNYPEGQYFFGNTFEGGDNGTTLRLTAGFDITFSSNWIGAGYGGTNTVLSLSRETGIAPFTRLSQISFDSNEFGNGLVYLNNNQTRAFTDPDDDIVDDWAFSNNTFRFEAEGRLDCQGYGRCHRINNNTFYVHASNPSTYVIQIGDWLDGTVENNVVDIKGDNYSIINLMSDCQNITVRNLDINTNGTITIPVINGYSNGNIVTGVTSYDGSRSIAITAASFTTNAQIASLSTNFTKPTLCMISINLSDLNVTTAGYLTTNTTVRRAGAQYAWCSTSKEELTWNFVALVGSTLTLSTDNTLVLDIDGYWNTITVTPL